MRDVRVLTPGDVAAVLGRLAAAVACSLATPARTMVSSDASMRRRL